MNSVSRLPSNMLRDLDRVTRREQKKSVSDLLCTSRTASIVPLFRSFLHAEIQGFRGGPLGSSPPGKVKWVVNAFRQCCPPEHRKWYHRYWVQVLSLALEEMEGVEFLHGLYLEPGRAEPLAEITLRFSDPVEI